MNYDIRHRPHPRNDTLNKNYPDLERTLVCHEDEQRFWYPDWNSGTSLNVTNRLNVKLTICLTNVVDQVNIFNNYKTSTGRIKQIHMLDRIYFNSYSKLSFIVCLVVDFTSFQKKRGRETWDITVLAPTMFRIRKFYDDFS